MKNTKQNITKALNKVSVIEKRVKKILANLRKDNKEASDNEIKMINELLERTLKSIKNTELNIPKNGLKGLDL